VSENNAAQPALSQGSATVTGMGHQLGYARVSTTDQQPQLQVDALKAAGCYRVFTETASGARSDRPTLAQLLDQLRPGDTLVVWKLDRLGHSLRHLVDTVTGLAERGIGFRSLQEAIDTTTPGGKLVFHVFAALAEFERDLIRERTAAGPAAARARGRHGGRPSVLTGSQAPGGPGDVPLWAVAKDRSSRSSGVEPVAGVRAAGRQPWSLWLLTVVLLTLGAWLEALNAPARGSPWQQSLGLVPLSLPFATIGALIASRHRDNPIGWLLCGFGLVVAVLLVGNQYSRYALVTTPGSLPVGDWAAWLAVWPVELTAPLLILVLLLFPDGRWLSPRWRPLVWLAVGLGLVSAATSALSGSTSRATSPMPNIPSSCSTRRSPGPSTTPARPCSWAFSSRPGARSWCGCAGPEGTSASSSSGSPMSARWALSCSWPGASSAQTP
jgi:Resolvase, N terminal domain